MLVFTGSDYELLDKLLKLVETQETQIQYRHLTPQEREWMAREKYLEVTFDLE